MGAEAVVDAAAEGEVRVRVRAGCRTSSAGRRPARRGWPTPPRTAPCRRARWCGRRGSPAWWPCAAWPATAWSSAAPPRWRCRAGPGRPAGRPAGRAARARASTPPEMAWRVVSAPAANSSEKNAYSSTSVSWAGSTSGSDAWMTTESMSSVGCGPLRRDQLDAVVEHAGPGRRRPRRCAVGEADVALAHVEPGVEERAELVAVLLGDAEQDADGLHRQLARPPSATKSTAVAVLHRVEQDDGRGAAAPPRAAATVRGVRPGLTSRRIRAWRGSSIIDSTIPATSRSWSRVPPWRRSPPRSEE